MLPIQELEPGLGPLIPVGMELPTPTGYADNLFVTPEGNLVLVECKLWRNPEARRRVLAQIIDYAQAMSAWEYTDLDRAIGQSIGPDKKPVSKTLLEIVRSQSEEPDAIEEPAFIDAVQKNLRRGRMLLLVLGDGIREDTESLTKFLQQHAGFHFTLGLIEAAVYQLSEGQFLVQPRILARTLNIERVVISVPEGTTVAPPSAITEEPPRPVSLSETAYFERLNAASPETASALRDFLTKAADIGVFLDMASKSATLRWESPLGKLYSLGGVDLQGRLSTYSVCWAPYAIGRVDIGHAYLAELAPLADAEVRQTDKSDQWYLVWRGHHMELPPAISVLRRATDWIDRITRYQGRIAAAETES